jgi:hypothetical protein
MTSQEILQETLNQGQAVSQQDASPRLESDVDWLRFGDQLAQDLEQILGQGSAVEQQAAEGQHAQTAPEGDVDVNQLLETLGVQELKDVQLGPPPEPSQQEQTYQQQQEALLRQVAQNALYLQVLARTNPAQFWNVFRAIDPQGAEMALRAARGEEQPAQPTAQAVQPSPAAMEALRQFVEHYQRAHATDEDVQKKLEELDQIEDPFDRLEAKMRFIIDHSAKQARQQQLRDAVLLQALSELFKKGEERFGEALKIAQSRELANRLRQYAQALRMYAETWENKQNSESAEIRKKLDTWLERAGIDVSDDVRRQAVTTALASVLYREFPHVVENYYKAIQSLDDKRITEARRSFEKALISAIAKVRAKLGVGGKPPASAVQQQLQQQQQQQREEQLFEEARRAFQAAEELGIKFV